MEKARYKRQKDAAKEGRRALMGLPPKEEEGEDEEEVSEKLSRKKLKGKRESMGVAARMKVVRLSQEVLWNLKQISTH